MCSCHFSIPSLCLTYFNRFINGLAKDTSAASFSYVPNQVLVKDYMSEKYL